MNMQLLSVNVGHARTIEHDGRAKISGICKQPVDGPVVVGEQGLAGDTQVDRRYHGGIDKAVYAYSQEDYDWWAPQLPDHQLTPGTFGENLTLGGLTSDVVRVGDRYRIGTALLEVTQPRQPCATLGIRMQMPKFVKQFHEAVRPGFYLRVLERGELTAGDEVTPEYQAADSLTIAEIYRLRFAESATAAELRRAVELPGLSDDWRGDFRKLLETAANRTR